MATKKRRGLSGSPEHHLKEAGKRYSAARERYNYAADSAQNKKCSEAFQLLMRAERFDGSAQAHDLESGASRAKAEAERTAKSAMLAESAFRDNCLISARLSGMKRRSRR